MTESSYYGDAEVAHRGALGGQTAFLRASADVRGVSLQKGIVGFQGCMPFIPALGTGEGQRHADHWL